MTSGYLYAVPNDYKYWLPYSWSGSNQQEDVTIPNGQGYTGWVLRGKIAINGGVWSAALNLRVNDDTSAIYQMNYIRRQDAGITAVTSGGFLSLATIPGLSVVEGSYALSYFELMYYMNANIGQQELLFKIDTIRGSSPGQSFSVVGRILINSLSTIQSINLIGSSAPEKIFGYANLILIR